VYRFLASPRWLAIHAGTAVAITAFVLLGLWQLGQFQRPAVSTSVDPGAAVQLTQVSIAGGPGEAAAAGRLVTVSGTYDGRRQVLVADRRLRGRAGYVVLTPLRTADGSAVIVDRGWVPAAGVAATAVPAGRVTVTGRLARSETDADTGVPPLADPPPGRAYRVNSEELGSVLPYPVHGGYLSLLDQQPPSPAAPEVAAAGEGGGGRWYNAGYTMQWFLFAIAAAGFWARLVLTELRERRGVDVGAVSGAAGPSLPRI
jgi:cytochrome oxidase assembly protein ShyY1